MKDVKKSPARARNKLEVRIPCSTSVFGLPDFKRDPDHGKIKSLFSRGSPDCQRPCLHNQDVLIGRYPMHKRSDVQKVRAVYSELLAYVQDFVVVPTRGRNPLGEELAKGDYDSDRYRICWDPPRIKGFRNAVSPVPLPNPPAELGIEVDLETLLVKLRAGGVDNFLRKNC